MLAFLLGTIFMIYLFTPFKKRRIYNNFSMDDFFYIETFFQFELIKSYYVMYKLCGYSVIFKYLYYAHIKFNFLVMIMRLR